MKRTLHFLVLSLLLLLSTTAKSQILISLIFGEALNTPKIEFGLVGGLNRSNILTLENASPLNNFNLGFYFHINLKNNSYISTGVLVKSNVGASGMPTYKLGDNAFDSLYSNGSLTKKISYFYVPLQYHYRIHNRWYLEGGFQIGLRNKARDIFKVDELNGELTYDTDTRDQYSRIDAGLVGGIGFKFKKEQKSMSVGVSYYYGLVDVSKVEGVSVMNTSFNVFAKIPIGMGGKKETSAKD